MPGDAVHVVGPAARAERRDHRVVVDGAELVLPVHPHAVDRQGEVGADRLVEARRTPGARTGVARPGSGAITRLGYEPPSSCSAVGSGSAVARGAPGARARPARGSARRACARRPAPPRIRRAMLADGRRSGCRRRCRRPRGSRCGRCPSGRRRTPRRGAKLLPSSGIRRSVKLRAAHVRDVELVVRPQLALVAQAGLDHETAADAPLVLHEQRQVLVAIGPAGLAVALDVRGREARRPPPGWATAPAG